MKILIYILLTTIIVQTASRCLNSRSNCCNSDCCESSNCCESNCCKEQTNCCTSSRRCPKSQPCSNSCDDDDERQPCKEQPPCRDVPVRTSTVPPSRVPTVQTVFRPSYSPSNASHITRNENVVHVPTNINISNIINTETRVFVPINVTFKSYNNVQVIPSTTQYNYTVPTNPILAPPEKNIEVHHNHTQVVQQPVYVPVPGRDRYVWVPYSYPVPQQQQNCCNMVQPCLWNNCQSVNKVCNQGCTGGKTVYNPVNPCIGGCDRMQYWDKQICDQNGCGNVAVDCSKCHPDCFKSFEGFSQCGGCFQSKGLPWQNGMMFG